MPRRRAAKKKEPPAPGPILRFVKQRYNADCGVVALAMFTGLRYEDVLVAVGRPIIDSGMSVQDIIDTAERLKHPLKWSRKFDLEDDTGILGIRSDTAFVGGFTEHVVVLHEGLIFDTDGTVWEVDDYIKRFDAKPMSLLVRK